MSGSNHLLSRHLGQQLILRCFLLSSSEEQKQADAQGLFDFCAECLDNFVKDNFGDEDGKVELDEPIPMGFTFSYPCQCVPSLDGPQADSDPLTSPPFVRVQAGPYRSRCLDPLDQGLRCPWRGGQGLRRNVQGRPQEVRASRSLALLARPHGLVGMTD